MKELTGKEAPIHQPLGSYCVEGNTATSRSAQQAQTGIPRASYFYNLLSYCRTCFLIPPDPFFLLDCFMFTCKEPFYSHIMSLDQNMMPPHLTFNFMIANCPIYISMYLILIGLFKAHAATCFVWRPCRYPISQTF